MKSFLLFITQIQEVKLFVPESDNKKRLEIHIKVLNVTYTNIRNSDGANLISTMHK